MKNRSIYSLTAGLSWLNRSSIAAAAMALVGAGAALAAPGALDLSFGGGDGLVVEDSTGGDGEYVTAVAVYPSGPHAGKIVTVGYVLGASGLNDDILVSRYLANGTPDATFGTGGHFTHDVGGNADDANAVALDPATGAIFVAGFTSDDPDYYSADLDSLVLKLDATGALDASFGTGGVVVTPLITVSNDEYRGIALQGDGKVVVCGQAMNDSTNDFSVVRYTAAGALDTTFSNDGILMAGITVEDLAEDLLIQPDGMIVVVGETHGLAGTKGANNDMAMIRVNSDGSLDTGFGTAGRRIQSFSTGYDRAESVARLADGSLIVAGRCTAPNAAVVAKFTAKGLLDAKFGVAGLAITPLVAPTDDVSNFNFGSSSLFGSLAIQSDNKVLFTAYEFNGTENKTQGVLYRLTSLGLLDTAFGVNGKVALLEGEYSDAVGTAITPSGKILVAGNTIDGTDNADELLAQYDGDVTLTTSAATSVASTSAQLNGNVIGSGTDANVSFQWGTSATALTNTLVVTTPVTPSASPGTSVNATLGFLIPGTKIFYRITANGALGNIVEFTPPKSLTPVVPGVVTLAATSVTSTGATLNGSVTTSTSTNAGFQWTSGTVFNNSVTTNTGLVASQNINTTLTGLLPHTKYTFIARASTSTGTTLGKPVTFTTLNTPPDAVNDSGIAVAPGGKITISPLVNDTDADAGDQAKLKVVSIVAPAATAGKAAITKTGQIEFIAASTFSGVTFNYTVTDGFNTDTASIAITLATPVLSPTTAVVSPEGGVVAVNVSVNPGVGWVATKTDSWISLYPATSTTSSGELLITVAANKTALARVGTVRVGGVNFSVSQNPGLPPSFVAASFTALVKRDSVFSGNLGGYISLASTATGDISGKLTLGGISYAIKGALTDPDPTAGGNRRFITTIVRKTPLAPLRLQLTFDETTNPMVPSFGFGSGDGLSLFNGPGTNVAVEGYRTVYGKAPLRSINADIPNAADPLKGSDYTVALKPTWEAERGIPDGDGYLTMKLAPLSGAATWVGKLADGTVVTGAGQTWPTGEIPLHTALYNTLGSISGVTQLEAAVAPSTRCTISTVSGDFALSWYKPRNGQRPYPGAFDGVETFDVVGARWIAPTGSQYVIGLSATSNNARITFANGEIEGVAQFGDLDQVFSIASGALANKVTPGAVGNPALVKVTAIDAAKGIFKGSMALTDTVSGITHPRPVTFEGVFVDDGASTPGLPLRAGAGFFLLTTLPDVTGETLAKNQQLSGSVSITNN